MKAALTAVVAAATMCVGLSADDSTMEVPTSCTDLSDGEYLLKLIDDDAYPLIWAQCSNGFVIFDYSKDNDWINYLSSYKRVYKTIGAPQKDDHSNWKDYYLGSVSETLVSPQCTTCESDDKMNVYGAETAYYHSASISACVQMRVSRAACDMRLSDDVCQSCWEDEDNGKWDSKSVYDGVNQLTYDSEDVVSADDADFDFTSVGSCPFHVYKTSSALLSDDNFQMCGDMTSFFGNDTVAAVHALYKPSFGLDGKHCMCLKSADDATEYVSISTEAYTEKMEAIAASNDIAEVTSGALDDLYYLYASDFEDGTYRILKSGTYVLMDDVVFDFKSIDYSAITPTSVDSLGQWNGFSDGWWPTEADSDRYEGAGALMGPYWMGFYAGISIEADNVILDLNQHSLSMSTAFYYQQGFFALIALTSQTFIPFQGFGNFGSDPTFASYVTVKNGKLGLSSHHGIQGHYNRYVTLEDLHITDFKTHGIQMAGFEDVTIRNVEIGPNSIEDKLRPYYTQMRHLLPIYKTMATDEAISDACVSLSNRETCVTMTDLVDELVIMLDMAFEYAVTDKDWDSLIENGALTDDEVISIWNKNKDAFISEKGTPQTSSLYGIFMNYPGSNVLLWYTNKVHSKLATLENVYVHDLTHNSQENVGFAHRGPIQTPYQSPVNAYQVFGYEWVQNMCTVMEGDSVEMRTAMIDSAVYIGNTATDLFVTAYEMVRSHGGSWNYISQSSNDMWRLANWVVNGDNSDLFEESQFSFVGGQDAMFHPGKGVLGVRFNGVDGIVIEGLTIENLASHTEIGFKWAEYGDNPTIQSPYMRDFGMNGVQALTITHSELTSLNDITIQNIQSDTGLVYGIAVWFSTDYLDAFGDSITVTDLEGGVTVEDGTMDYDTSPNYAPEACAVLIQDSNGFLTLDASQYPHSEQWTIAQISAEYGCQGSTSDYTSMGTISTHASSPIKHDTKSNAANTFFTNHMSGVNTFGSIFILLCVLSLGAYYKRWQQSVNKSANDTTDEIRLKAQPASSYGSF